VPVREAREPLGCHRAREPAGELVRLARARAVASLPDPEDDEQLLHVLDRERAAHAVERVREGVHETPLAEERGELEHRRTVRLEVAVVLLGEVPDEHVQRDLAAGEIRRHLDREERVGKVRDPQRALDGVVVADRDEVHAARLADAVHALGVRVGLAEACATQRVVPAVRRVDRVHVQVATSHRYSCSARCGRLLPIGARRRDIDTASSPQRHRARRLTRHNQET
jgi:hypothetical protein